MSVTALDLYRPTSDAGPQRILASKIIPKFYPVHPRLGNISRSYCKWSWSGNVRLPIKNRNKRPQELDQGISIYQWYIWKQQLLWVTQAKYTVISTIIIPKVWSSLQNLWLTCSFRWFDHLRCKLTRPKAFTVWPTNRIQWNFSDVHSTFISQWNTGYMCLDIELFATCINACEDTCKSFWLPILMQVSTQVQLVAICGCFSVCLTRA